MGAVAHEVPRAMRPESMDDPGTIDRTDVVARASLGAICGPDPHGCHHGEVSGVPAGARIGREVAGTGEAAGVDVRGVHPGDRVLTPSWIVGPIDPVPILTQTAGSEGPAADVAMAAREPGRVKVTVRP